MAIVMQAFNREKSSLSVVINLPTIQTYKGRTKRFWSRILDHVGCEKSLLAKIQKGEENALAF
jgi:hypothetical protein